MMDEHKAESMKPRDDLDRQLQDWFNDQALDCGVDLEALKKIIQTRTAEATTRLREALEGVESHLQRTMTAENKAFMLSVIRQALKDQGEGR